MLVRLIRTKLVGTWGRIHCYKGFQKHASQSYCRSRVTVSGFRRTSAESLTVFTIACTTKTGRQPSCPPPSPRSNPLSPLPPRRLRCLVREKGHLPGALCGETPGSTDHALEFFAAEEEQPVGVARWIPHPRLNTRRPIRSVLAGGELSHRSMYREDRAL